MEEHIRKQREAHRAKRDEESARVKGTYLDPERYSRLPAGPVRTAPMPSNFFKEKNRALRWWDGTVCGRVHGTYVQRMLYWLECKLHYMRMYVQTHW